jgi:hypothetical protein
MAAEMRGIGVPAEKAEAEAKAMEGRTRLRIAWARERFAEFLTLQDAAGEAWDREMAARPHIDWDADDAPELPPPPEEALAQAVYDEVIAAFEHDRWPRHLHFHQI